MWARLSRRYCAGKGAECRVDARGSTSYEFPRLSPLRFANPSTSSGQALGHPHFRGPRELRRLYAFQFVTSYFRQFVISQLAYRAQPNTSRTGLWNRYQRARVRTRNSAVEIASSTGEKLLSAAISAGAASSKPYVRNAMAAHRAKRFRRKNPKEIAAQSTAENAMAMGPMRATPSPTSHDARVNEIASVARAAV